MLKKQNIIIVLFLIFVAYIGFSAYLFPGQIILLSGENPIKMPRFFALRGDGLYWGKESLTLKPGENSFTLNFLGVLPIKDTQVFLLEPIYLRLGGHSVGVVLEGEGLKISGFYPIIIAGREIWPGKDAGLEVGDILLEANGIELKNPDDLQRLAQNYQELHLIIRRNNKSFKTTIYPTESSNNTERVLGIFLQDPVMGVGTLTFATEDGFGFAALGHIIGDGENDKKGTIKKARIVGVRKGERGTPGEKLGLFEKSGYTLGNITKNSQLGIYGKLTEPLDSPLVELAFYEEVKVGPAQVVTVLKDETIESFDAYIDQIFLRREPTNRSFVIRITDPRLIEETGGIVQGMSGSPILQNGKLVGAITHVFVNDPTRGYGALAEWMALEAGAFENIDKKALGA